MRSLVSRAGLAVVAAVTALALAACSSSGDPLSSSGAPSSGAVPPSGVPSGSGSGAPGGKPISIGSADFTESVIIAELYAAALNSAGVPAITKPRLGAREIYLKALTDGSINLIPEYTGAALLYFDKKATANSDPEKTYADLKKVLPKNLQVLAKSPAEDKDSLTVTKETADKWKLKTIEDLKGHSQELVLGGPEEWKTRMTGVPGFKKYYGLTFKSFEVADLGQVPEGLTTGILGAGNVLTTDPAIAKNNLVSLQDTKHMFGSQNVVPLIAKDAVTPEVTTVLDKLSGALTTADLIELNDKVSGQHLDAKSVAADWVKAKLG